MSSRTILVVGGTGAMGRPVVRHLLADEREGFNVRVLTRNKASREAGELAAIAPSRVELVEGDSTNQEVVEAAMRGAYGVFCNTNFFSRASVEAEYEEGVRFLEAARRADVQHFVWSSLDSMGALSEGRLPCPHFDAKAAVGAYIDRRRADDFMRRGMPGFSGDAWYLERTTILVTLPYIENFKSFVRPYPGRLPDGREGLIWTLPLGDAAWPMVALEDIGAFTAIVFRDPEAWRGRTLPIGSESLTMHQVAEIFTRVTGIPSAYYPMSMDDFEKIDMPFKHDFINMLKFFREVGLSRDHARLRSIHPGLLTFEAWLRQTGFRGEPEEFMKSAADARARAAT